MTPSRRVAGGVSRRWAASQPTAWRQANSYSALDGPGSSKDVTASRSTSSMVRSTDRRPRLSSSSRLAASSSKAINAPVSRDGVDGPSPRSRASEIAEDTLCVSDRVSRSASISVSEYWR